MQFRPGCVIELHKDASPNTTSHFAHPLVSDEKTSKVMPIPAAAPLASCTAASAAVAPLRPSLRREEEREDSGKTEGEDGIWGPCRSHHFFYYFVCETDMWVLRVLLFFQIELQRKRHVNATSDVDRVKLAT